MISTEYYRVTIYIYIKKKYNYQSHDSIPDNDHIRVVQGNSLGTFEDEMMIMTH